MAKGYSELARRLYVCVDGCVNREPVGRIYSPMAGRCGFGGVLPMIYKMESVFDNANCPQPTHEMRSFEKRPKRRARVAVRKEPEKKEMTDVTENLQDKTIKMQDENGKQATFVISVKYRQNATWQGKIQWIEQKKEQTFRSTLEMIKLMDDALSSAKDGEEFDGWDAI